MSEELAAWEMPLPNDWHGFSYARSEKLTDEYREVFTCDRNDEQLFVVAYFHEETREYKLRIKIGLNELVRIEFISGSLADFTERLKIYFEPLLAELANFSHLSVPPLLRKKGLGDWDYDGVLPKNLAGFTLFITPDSPFPIANGSYIVADYSDFSKDSNFTIMYNVFRDEFFGESRIAGVPTVTYEFDAKNLTKLETILRSKLKKHLLYIVEKCSA